MLKVSNVETSLGALEGLDCYIARGVHFRFVPASGTAGDDYDIEATLDSRKPGRISVTPTR
jgi:hypothetical protein